jgi:AcrR family transcriptional regulator
MKSADDPVAAWLRPHRAAVGPKPEYSREQIAAEAIALADSEGIDAVSIRRVALSVGTGPASLYRYISSRDELLELMMDAVAGEYALDSPEGPPAAQLVDLGLQGRTIMHRHPWLPPLLLTRPSLGPNSLAYLDRAMRALDGCQLAAADRLQAVAMLTAITSAFVQNEISAATLVGRDGTPSARLSYLSEVVGSGRYPSLAAAFTSPPAVAGPEELLGVLIQNHLAGSGLRDELSS